MVYDLIIGFFAILIALVVFYWLGAVVRWMIGRFKEPFKNYRGLPGIKNLLTGALVYGVVMLFVIFFRKSRMSDEDMAAINARIQLQVDSAAWMYELALYDLGKGLSKDSVLARYEKIIPLKKTISDEFDSITGLYKAGKIDKDQYEKAMHGVMLDSARYYQQEAKQAGLIFSKE